MKVLIAVVMSVLVFGTPSVAAWECHDGDGSSPYGWVTPDGGYVVHASLPFGCGPLGPEIDREGALL